MKEKGTYFNNKDNYIEKFSNELLEDDLTRKKITKLSVSLCGSMYTPTL